MQDPINNRYLNSSCDRAWVGWPCDAQLEDLRRTFVRTSDIETQRALAARIQLRAIEVTPYIHLGQLTLVSAARREVTGFLNAGPTVFWNVQVKR